MLIKDIQVNLGKRCNNNCLFCVSHHRGEPNVFIKEDRLRQYIKKYAAKGYNSLGFLGGEPTIYPDFERVVRYAKEQGFAQIHVVSNGRRFADQKLLKRLITAGVTRFSVSLHSDDPELEDYMTGVPGSFQQKFQGIKNLALFRQKGLIKTNLSINIVLNKLNYKTIRSTIEKFSALGVNNFRINFIRPEGNAWENFKVFVPRFKLVFKMLQDLITRPVLPGITVVFEGIPFCVFKDIPNFLKHVGELRDFHDMTLVCEDNKGQNNLSGYKGKHLTDSGPYQKLLRLKSSREDKSFSWKDKRKNFLKTKPASCTQCIYDPVCEGVYVNYTSKYGFAEFKPVKDVTRARKK